MISIDSSSAVSPVEQIRSQLAAQIRAGQLAPDVRLPPVRQLAADLRVAQGSVAKAYRELENAGLIRTMRGAGTRVNPGHASTEPLIRAATDFARQAAEEGLSLRETHDLLAHAWVQLHPEPSSPPAGFRDD
ncbi:GntR family transcriptional regulator [Nesterenkonia sandarakina]|uniref:DNA-binding transcriptional regulator YhcF (GntR family) n=1 Tax=Nesterenkonia sandarakina TaxID=272918 RepID=A0A7Z0EAK6_9MICC|nr:GntR family transcriptional regulator [Nesterenkonia sandarakina]NYJ17474.1 DNA-binding transcriptional regulator YhcF (GntR family) [Nesterenkonia sandarakina]